MNCDQVVWVNHLADIRIIKNNVYLICIKNWNIRNKWIIKIVASDYFVETLVSRLLLIIFLTYKQKNKYQKKTIFLEVAMANGSQFPLKKKRQNIVMSQWVSTSKSHYFALLEGKNNTKNNTAGSEHKKL